MCHTSRRRHRRSTERPARPVPHTHRRRRGGRADERRVARWAGGPCTGGCRCWRRLYPRPHTPTLPGGGTPRLTRGRPARASPVTRRGVARAHAVAKPTKRRHHRRCSRRRRRHPRRRASARPPRAAHHPRQGVGARASAATGGTPWSQNQSVGRGLRVSRHWGSQQAPPTPPPSTRVDRAAGTPGATPPTKSGLARAAATVVCVSQRPRQKRGRPPPQNRRPAHGPTAQCPTQAFLMTLDVEAAGPKRCRYKVA